MKKTTLAILTICALVLGIAASWFSHNSQPIKLETARWFGDQARALPDFELYDHNQQILGKPQLAGKWSLMFFGYTNCPDICPISMQTLNNTLEAIEDRDVRNSIKVVFVSVDPERDNAERLAEYVQYFNPEFYGASAPLSELNKLTGSIGISHSLEKTSEAQTDYLVSHSGAIILLNPEVEFAGIITAPQDALAMARDLTRIIERH